MSPHRSLPPCKCVVAAQLPAELCAGESFGDWVKCKTP